MKKLKFNSVTDRQTDRQTLTSSLFTTKKLFLCGIVSLIFFSCKKENLEHANISSAKISTYKGILRFDAPSTLKETIEELEQTMEANTLQFYSNHGIDLSQINENTSQDELDQIDRKIEIILANHTFNENKGYLDFENQFNYNSLRSKGVALQKAGNSDDIYSNLLEHTEIATILNEYYEFMVGDTIVKILPDGALAGIINFDFNLVQELREHPLSYENIQNPNLIVRNPKSKKCTASTYKYATSSWDYFGNRRYQYKTGLTYFWFGNIAFSQVKCQKKIGKKWRNRARRTRTKVAGFYYAIHFCNEMGSNSSTWKWKWGSTNRKNHWINHDWNQGWVPGVKQGTQSGYITLTDQGNASRQIPLIW